MIIDEIKSISSTNTDLKKFGYLVGSVILLIGFYLYFIKNILNIYLWIIGIVLIILALIKPIILIPFQKIWMAIAVVLGQIMTTIILSIFFYVCVTPIAILGKIFKKHFLDININKKLDSYWHYRNAKEQENHDYSNQF